MRTILRRFSIVLLLLTLVLNCFGSETDTVSIETKSHGEKFVPGEFILDHILDSHEWHILSFKGHHVSIPLPIIAYSEKTGLHVFMSSKFEHGHATYQGLTIPAEGPNKGNIVEVQEIDGKEVETAVWDFSITKVVFSLLISVILVLVVFISIARKYQKNPDKAPSGLQSALEPMILFVRDDIAKPSIGHNFEKYMPYLLTIFFFIWFNNMLGLIPLFPGGVNVTGNISITLVMALFTFVITTFSGNKHYWKEIINPDGVPIWLKLSIMPIIEILGVFIKPFVLMVRLFANITAGHLIAMAFVSLIFIFAEMNPFLGYGMSLLSAAFSLFMGLLEVLVALIQAYVFTFLSALYFGMATAEHH
jgi:F-type H+-transporting ATPase subunit a